MEKPSNRAVTLQRIEMTWPAAVPGRKRMQEVLSLSEQASSKVFGPNLNGRNISRDQVDEDQGKSVN